MSTIILLSSSPPQIFADPPTQAGSPLPKFLIPTPNLVKDVNNVRGFAAKTGGRVGYANNFTTARSMLEDKLGAVNAPIACPGRKKFKVSSTAFDDLRDIKSAGGGFMSTLIPEKASQNVEVLPSPEVESANAEPREVESKLNTARETTTRKLDWTPVKDTVVCCDDNESPIGASTGVFDRLSSTFSFNNQCDSVSFRREESHVPIKRIKLDLVEAGSDAPIVQSASPDRKRKRTSKVTSKKSAKSAPKKSLTITGLAANLYHGQHADEATPLMQYLTSTQAQLAEEDELIGLAATAKAARKTSKRIKLATKSLLVSPTSAMRMLEAQDVIFGSASQLARDESPTFIRDTIEATRMSESFLMSDPVSPQRTQAYSTASSTPRAAKGTARFTRTRNLWDAAGRDENNALLHVDTVDLSNTPAMKLAFAGPDALTAPELAKQPRDSPLDWDLSLHADELDNGQKEKLVDIDDVNTPSNLHAKRVLPAMPRREMHTSARVQSPRRVLASASTPVPVTNTTDLEKSKKPVEPQKVVGQKPSYAGFATHDLQKQISAYGFKPVKKREKMIELLEKCWDEKHGFKSSSDAIPSEEANVISLKHGDFLGKVHDISARPVPKVKKPVGRQKKVKDPSATKDKAPVRKKKVKDLPDHPEKPAKKRRKTAEEKAVAKTPRKRKVASKSTDVVNDDSKPQTPVPRKRKPKAKPLSDEMVLDIDDIDTNVGAPVLEQPQTTAQAQCSNKPKQSKSTKRLLTPSTAVPYNEVPCTSEDELDLTLPPSNQEAASQRSLSPITSPSEPPVVHAQIRKAILSESTPLDTRSNVRNHRKNPTWHEKILLYDPIVLEDLTAWLNTQGLNAIGEDREVSAMEVREWCEQAGICCLWKGGWRGNNRKSNPDVED